MTANQTQVPDGESNDGRVLVAITMIVALVAGTIYLIGQRWHSSPVAIEHRAP
ncbi:MAG TPA: hypothetical protein VJB98_00660 [Candidatus Paceibacterota bacterium]